MGYFSSLAIDKEEDYMDYSYPSPDSQLRWRLEDLYSRLEEINEGNIPARYIDEGLRLTDDEIRYAIPKYFVRALDVERAIELAISDLKFKYDIDMDKLDEDEPIPEPSLIGQLYFDGLDCMPNYKMPQRAA